MPYTVASPSPVPLPTSLVVKNGSNRWGRTLASIPPPLSVAGRLGLEPLAAAVRRMWPGRARCRFGCFADLLDGAALGIAGRQLAQQQLRVPENRRPEVVEVVRDSAGELPHRLHLLRLAELLLEMPLLRDIPLCSPYPHQMPVFDEADDVIKEDARPSLAVVLSRFRV